MTGHPNAPFAGGLLVLTDRAQAASHGRGLGGVIAAAIDGGARTVLLREKDLPRPERGALAATLAELLRPVDGTLLVSSDVGLAAEVGAAGVHLAADDPWPSAGTRPRVVGRSCHSVDDLRVALTKGAGYATLSPIWPSPSKPGYGPALGLGELAAACAAVPGLPVVALGGVTRERVAGCRAAGAAAVAVMGEVMRADDPAACVRSLLAELQGRAGTLREAR